MGTCFESSPRSSQDKHVHRLALELELLSTRVLIPDTLCTPRLPVHEQYAAEAIKAGIRVTPQDVRAGFKPGELAAYHWAPANSSLQGDERPVPALWEALAPATDARGVVDDADAQVSPAGRRKRKGYVDRKSAANGQILPSTGTRRPRAFLLASSRLRDTRTFPRPSRRVS